MATESDVIQTHKLLQDTIKFYESHEWTQFSFARNAQDSDVDMFGEEAVKFCINAALIKAAGFKDHHSERRTRAYYDASIYLGKANVESYPDQSKTIWQTNDHCYTSKDDAVKALSRAVELIKADYPEILNVEQAERKADEGHPDVV